MRPGQSRELRSSFQLGAGRVPKLYCYFRLFALMLFVMKSLNLFVDNNRKKTKTVFLSLRKTNMQLCFCKLKNMGTKLSADRSAALKAFRNEVVWNTTACSITFALRAEIAHQPYLPTSTVGHLIIFADTYEEMKTNDHIWTKSTSSSISSSLTSPGSIHVLLLHFMSHFLHSNSGNCNHNSCN